jgi:peptidyl-prolyl cis-trans isomerase C
VLDTRSVLRGVSIAVLLGGLLVTVVCPTATEAQDRALAKIGNQTITESDLKDMLEGVAAEDQTPETKRQALDYLVNTLVIASEAQAQGFDKDPKIQKRLDLARTKVLAMLYMTKLTETLPQATESQAKEYYEKNRDQFSIPESIRLHHILVKTDKEAQDVLRRLKKNEKFADVAAQVSLCDSRSQGGDLGWRPRGQLVKEVEDVAFAMTPGQISAPVKSEFGIHVLFLEDKKPAQPQTFDQVKEQIVEILRATAQEDYLNSVAQKLRQKMNVQITVPADWQGQGAKPAGSAPMTSPKN